MLLITILLLQFYMDFEIYEEKSIRVVLEDVTLDTGIEDAEGNTTSHGYCEPFKKKITLDKEYFENLPFIYQRELLYHELGHCALGLNHVEEEDIMRPRVYSTNKDGSNWKYLVNKMKKRYNDKTK